MNQTVMPSPEEAINKHREETRKQAEIHARTERRNSFRFGLRERVRRIVSEGGTHAGIAVTANIEVSILQDWLGGSAAPDLENALADWLAQIEQEAHTDLPLVNTETTQTIHLLLETARREKQLVLIVGGPGVGKTTAAEQYRDQLHGIACPIVAVGQKRTGKHGITPTDLLGLILDEMGERGHSHRSSVLYNRVAEKLGYSWNGSRNLLILDESQDLPWRCLDAVRHFVDEGICGVVVMGNEGEYARMQTTDLLQPFASRIYQTLRLTIPSAADLDAVLNAWELKGGDLRRAARDIAQQTYGLRSLAHAVKIARELASVTGRELTGAILLQAAAQTIKPSNP